jgi:hypothetical protein
MRLLTVLTRFLTTDAGNVKQLEGFDPPRYRLRAGDWRIVFSQGRRGRYRSYPRPKPARGVSLIPSIRVLHLIHLASSRPAATTRCSRAAAPAGYLKRRYRKFWAALCALWDRWKRWVGRGQARGCCGLAPGWISALPRRCVTAATVRLARPGTIRVFKPARDLNLRSLATLHRHRFVVDFVAAGPRRPARYGVAVP